MTLQAWAAVAVFVVAYLLIATERVPRVAAALGGAAAMRVIGATDAEHAFSDIDSGVDWNVIFLLLGMMIIVGVLGQTGVFEFIAIWSAKRARGRPMRVMVLLVLITAVSSAALDNVTTVLLIAPVTLLVCERLGTPPIPFLLAEAMASNIGGTATLIGDPPNIIIASRAGLSFDDFIVNLAPLVVLLMVVFIGLCWLLFGRRLIYDPARAARVMALEERDMIRNPQLLRRSLAVLTLVLIGFSLHSLFHVQPSVIALLGAGLAVTVSRLEPSTYLADVEWETLVFFMGLFIMVGSLVHLGVIETLAQSATSAMGDRYLLGATGILFGSAVMSALVDNIPYVATMSPLVADVVTASNGHPQGQMLWWALALGADLGGNATAVGASANVVVTGIAARYGHPISFWHFTRYGIVVAMVTVLLSWPYIWLRYVVLAG